MDRSIDLAVQHIVEIRGDVTMRDGRRRTNEQVKIELLSRWKLEAEFRNLYSLTVLAWVYLSTADAFSKPKLLFFILMFRHSHMNIPKSGRKALLRSHNVIPNQLLSDFSCLFSFFCFVFQDSEGNATIADIWSTPGFQMALVNPNLYLGPLVFLSVGG